MMRWMIGLVSLLVMGPAGCGLPEDDADGDSAASGGGETGDEGAEDEGEESTVGAETGPEVTSGGETGDESGDGESEGSDTGDPPMFECTDIDLGNALPAQYTGPTGTDDTGLELVCGDVLLGSVGLWFEWTAPSDGTYRVAAEGVGLSPQIARIPSCGAYYGECPAPDLELDLSEGESILFAVTERDGEAGEVSVTIQ